MKSFGKGDEGRMQVVGFAKFCLYIQPLKILTDIIKQNLNRKFKSLKILKGEDRFHSIPILRFLFIRANIIVEVRYENLKKNLVVS